MKYVRKNVYLYQVYVRKNVMVDMNYLQKNVKIICKELFYRILYNGRNVLTESH